MKLSMNFFPEGPVDYMSALVQIMADQTTKPLSETTTAHYTEEYMHYLVSMSQIISVGKRICIYGPSNWNTLGSEKGL